MLLIGAQLNSGGFSHTFSKVTDLGLQRRKSQDSDAKYCFKNPFKQEYSIRKTVLKTSSNSAFSEYIEYCYVPLTLLF